MKLFVIAIAVAAAAFATPSAASAQAAPPAPAPADDILNRIISVPSPTAYTVSGLREGGRVRGDEGVQGGRALRVAVPEASPEAWRVSVAVPITQPVRSGDNLVLAFWARLHRGPEGATTSTLSNVAVQLTRDPWTATLNGPVTIGPEWQLHELRGRAARDYAAGDLNVTMHVGNARHTFDVGPVFVLNMDQ